MFRKIIISSTHEAQYPRPRPSHKTRRNFVRIVPTQTHVHASNNNLANGTPTVAHFRTRITKLFAMLAAFNAKRRRRKQELQLMLLLDDMDPSLLRDIGFERRGPICKHTRADGAFEVGN